MARGRPDFSVAGKVVVSEVEVVTEMPDTTPRGSQGIAFRQKAGSGEGYVSPTGHNDPDGDWSNEANAYDDDTGTRARNFMDYGSRWYGYLELTLASAIRSNKCRFWADLQRLAVTLDDRAIQVQVYKDGAWETVATITDFTVGEWVEVTYPEGTVEKMRVRFYCPIEVEADAWLYEADVYQVSTAGGELYVLSDDATLFLATVTQGAKDRTLTITKTNTQHSQGSIAAGSYSDRDIDCTTTHVLVLQIYIDYHASATEGARIFLLGSNDNTNYDDEDIETAFAYIDPPFGAGTTKRLTRLYRDLPPYIRIRVRNHDGTYAIDSVVYEVTKVT